jgi:ABC-type antimicrobial peptide transport system permease subunit
MKHNRSSEATRTRAKVKRKDSPLRLVACASFLMAALGASVCLPSSILLPSTALAQMSTQGEMTSSPLSPSYSSSSLSGSITSSSSSSSSSSPSMPTTLKSPDFRFSYSKIGVSNGDYLRILYDSEANLLKLTNISTTVDENKSNRLSFSQGQSQSQSNRQLTGSDQIKLQEIINENGFFQTNGTYPPPNAGANNDNYHTLYALSIGMDNRVHTSIWSDASQNVPKVVLLVVEEIERILST